MLRQDYHIHCELSPDAHRAEDVAKGFDRAEELLREAGFSYAARYKERKPYFVKL